MLSVLRPAATGLVLAAIAAVPADAAITYIGQAAIPNGTDFSGLTGNLEDGLPGNRLGGFGSGIAYNGTDNTYMLIPDRGPNAVAYPGGAAVDNTISFQSRVEQFRLSVSPGAGPGGSGGSVNYQFVGTKLLTSGNGAALVGLSSSPNRFDPEAIRVGKYGTRVYISDEYGPKLNEFDANTGQLLRSFTMPPGFTIANPNPLGASELPPANTVGRQANRGAESLAISPDGTKLFMATQNPLIQDGALNGSNNRRGVNIRIVQFDIATGQAEKQFVYVLGDGTTAAPNGGRSLGINDMVAINGHELLIVERDGNGGASAAVKRIAKVDLTGATDISNLADPLPQTGLPPGVTAVSKTTLLDLLDPSFGLAGDAFPEKIEGLAFGPDLADGRHILFVTSDNDFLDTPTHVYAFAIGAADINYVAQVFVPEPASLGLLAVGAAGGVVLRRRRARGVRRSA
ncbi:MAG: esterase-like activity of phytase family protein [Acetobacteraceae bacterium]